MSKFLLFIFFTIVFINSCSFSKNIEKNIIKKSNYMLVRFDLALEDIILELLKSNNIIIFDKTLFFISSLDNRTNIIIKKDKLTDLIKNKISKNTNKIIFLKNKTIEQNKKKLGILNIKNSLDTSTAILLSRNNNVKYYLQSCIFEKNKLFFLKIKLILVRTGEIVFIKTKKLY